MKTILFDDKDRDGWWKGKLDDRFTCLRRGKRSSRCPMKSAVLGIALALMLSACSAHQQVSGTDGGGSGVSAGAISNQRNLWHGGVVGATPGTVTEATIADISIHAAREAAHALRPVEYRTENNRVYYFADPLGYEEKRRCRKVQEKIYEEGQLVRKRIIVFCDRGRYDRPAFRYDQRNDRYELGEE